MPKSKYKFDPERLSYEKIVLSRGQRFLKFLKQVAAIAVVAAIMLFVLSIFFDTPGERQQKRENKQLVAQYEFLNKKLELMEQTMEQIKAGMDEAAIKATWKPGLEAYKEMRKKYLLYKDFE